MLSQSYVRDDEENVIGRILVLKDISELKKKEDVINKQREQMIGSARLASLGEMAGGIAHEINNPLAAISATMKVVKKIFSRDEVDKEMIAECVEDIETTVQRIHKIVTGLRTISRSKSGDTLERTSAKDLLNDVLGLCSEKFKNSSVDLQIIDEIDLKNVKILCNRIPLSQVIINLLNNSFDAISGKEKKWIKINFSIDDEILFIKIIDCGNGIDEEKEYKIFQPFFTTKEIGKGTGVGLSLSKSLIEKQSGKLYIDHGSPNTCFVIEIPQREENSKRKAE
jgi:C4-dicarboxylate-specific signal transduction histidine kinase